MSDKQLAEVRARLALHEKGYRRSAWRWKTGYRVLLVGSALFSTSAAVVGKLRDFQFEGATDVAAILAGTAAVTTTLIAALDFEVNWRINRRSRHEVAVIVIESEMSTANADNLLVKLQDVVSRRSDDFSKQD